MDLHQAGQWMVDQWMVGPVECQVDLLVVNQDQWMVGQTLEQ